MAKRKIIYESINKLAEWTPFYRCESPFEGEEIWKNSRYQVHIRKIKPEKPEFDAMIHLSFKRLDQKPDISFRDKMRIKNELIGPEYDFVERYPAESSLVDTSNQYHMWGFDNPSFRWPFGWNERMVSEIEINGAKQNPWPENEKPVDLLTEEELRKALRKE